MIAGSDIWKLVPNIKCGDLVKQEHDGKKINYSGAPNLSHLEKELKKVGFICKTSLTKIQDGAESCSIIMPLHPMYRGNYVKKYEGKLVVISYNTELSDFMENYTPVPLSDA